MCDFDVGLTCRPWFSGSEIAIRIPRGLSIEETLSLKAEHVDAYANGTPYGRAIQRRPSLPAFDLQIMAYADGNVAWVSTIEGRCWLYNIETGIDISWPIEDPGKVTTVGLSASIVAVAVDSGFFIVWKLPKPGETAPLRLSLASSLVDSLVVWGNALAILYSPSWPHDQARITIWSSEGTLQHLTVDLHESLAGAWHRHPAVNLDRKMLITCGSVILLTKANIEGCLIDFVQLNYAGKVQARGFLRTQNLSEYYLSPFPMSATSGGCTVIWAAAERHLDSDHRPIGVNFARVIYDIHNDQLSFKEIKILTSEDPWSLLGIVFFFKDVAYCKKGQSCCGPISVIDMTQLKITPARVGRPERHGEGCYQLGASNRTILCGDETYLVELSEGGFCVWCFDKNANMANEDAAYREKMVSSRAERVNAIREAEIS